MANGDRIILFLRCIEPGELDTLIDHLLELRYATWPADDKWLAMRRGSESDLDR